VKKSRPVRRLVRNHRDFVVSVKHERIPMPGGGHLSASTMILHRERKGPNSAA
jgi:hypothetical protein